MFSGIVEAQSTVIQAQARAHVLQITVSRPSDFNDLHIGDSIAVNGVCLTVESFNEYEVQFALAAETLQVTQWSEESLSRRPLNLERSLRFGDRVHGHWVTGHVDAMAKVFSVEKLGESVILKLSVPERLEPFVWSKGSLTVNGVSLTLNEVQGGSVSLCLIPETLKRTNLGLLKSGEKVTVEVDSMARGLFHLLKTSRPDLVAQGLVEEKV